MSISLFPLTEDMTFSISRFPSPKPLTIAAVMPKTLQSGLLCPLWKGVF